MNPVMHRVYVGMMDPYGNASLETNISWMDRVAFDLIGWDIIGGGVPGDWRGVTLEQFSNDRNVAVATELEATDVAAPGTNALPATSQFLGAIGQAEKDATTTCGWPSKCMVFSPSRRMSMSTASPERQEPKSGSILTAPARPSMRSSS